MRCHCSPFTAGRGNFAPMAGRCCRCASWGDWCACAFGILSSSTSVWPCAPMLPPPPFLFLLGRVPRMTDSLLCTAVCGAVAMICPPPGQPEVCQMDSAAREKAALVAARPARPARSAWARIEARIEGGIAPKIPRTRFVICYSASVSLGKVPADGAARWFAGWRVAALGAERPGCAVQFRRGGRGSRPRCARASTIHPAKRKIYTLPPSL